MVLDEKQDFYLKRFIIDFSECWKFEDYYDSLIEVYERWEKKRVELVNEHKTKLGAIYRKAALHGLEDRGQFIYGSASIEDIHDPQERELAEYMLAQIEGLHPSIQTYHWHLNNMRAIRRLIRETKAYVEQFSPATQSHSGEGRNKKADSDVDLSWKQQLVLLDELGFLDTVNCKTQEKKAILLAKLFGGRSPQDIRTMLGRWNTRKVARQSDKDPKKYVVTDDDEEKVQDILDSCNIIRSGKIVGK